MSQKLVKSLLENYVEASNDASLQLPIAWPNAEFTPPQDRPWMSVDILPAPVQSIDIQQGTRIYRGVCQVSISCQLGTGSQAYDDVADTIAEWFPNTLLLSDPSAPGFTLGLTTPVTVYQGVESESGCLIPISFEYHAH